MHQRREKFLFVSNCTDLYKKDSIYFLKSNLLRMIKES